jgi:hypothetical protein
MTRRTGASETGVEAGGAAAIFSAGGGATGAGGFGAAAGGAAAAAGLGRGATAASAFLRRRFATSPGLEMCERSILVLISGSPEREPPSRPEVAPLCAAKCLRTRSASSASMELECVFFSVTPTAWRTSRIALLLTSSSLARSLIRTLLIRLCSLRIPLDDHDNPLRDLNDLDPLLSKCNLHCSAWSRQLRLR